MKTITIVLALAMILCVSPVMGQTYAPLFGTRLELRDGANQFTLYPPPAGITPTLTFPSSAPNDGDALVWHTGGLLSWEAPSSVGGTAGGDLTGTYPNPTIADEAVTVSKLAPDVLSSIPKTTYGGNTGGNVGNGTVHTSPFGSGLYVNEAITQIVCTRSGTLKNLFVHATVAPGLGAVRVVTIRKNGVATTLSVSLSDIATDGNNLIDSVPVSAFDRISVSIQSILATNAAISWGFELY